MVCSADVTTYKVPTIGSHVVLGDDQAYNSPENWTTESAALSNSAALSGQISEKLITRNQLMSEHQYTRRPGLVLFDLQT